MSAVVSRNVRFVGHTDQGGRSDGVQIMVHRGYAYIGHTFSNGITIVDVRDPAHPKTVQFIACSPNTRAVHLQVHEDLLLAVNGPSVWHMQEFQNLADYFTGSPADKLRARAGSFASGIRVFDISRPQKPTEIGFMPVDGIGPHRIWYTGGRYAYASILSFAKRHPLVHDDPCSCHERATPGDRRSRVRRRDSRQPQAIGPATQKRWMSASDQLAQEGRITWGGAGQGRQPAGEARSGRLPGVAMMKTADFGNLHDHAHLRSLDWPPIWRILLEREVSSRRVIVREVARQEPAQMAFAQDEDVIEALAPDRADEPFREGVRIGRRLQLNTT
jgi:hypothetical protein